MSKWIDRMATFDPKDSMRSDKVAFYFTEAGLLQCSIDGITTLTVPFSGATVITAATRAITAADNGTTLLANQPASAITFTLPAAAAGKTSVTIVNMIGNATQVAAHILDPVPADTIKGPQIAAPVLGGNVTALDAGANLPFQSVKLASDGVLTWNVVGFGTPPPALQAATASTAKAKTKDDDEDDDDDPKNRRFRK